MIPASMPTVSPNRHIGKCLNEARRLSDGANGMRWVVIIAPDGTLVKMSVPADGEEDPSLIRDVRNALSPANEPNIGQTITAIGCTTGVRRIGRSLRKLLELIPNLSYLIGAAFLGNIVVVFEGHPKDFAAGCAEADLLIVDDGMLPLLSPDWAAVALKTLRQPRIILFGRDGRLSKLDRLIQVDGLDGKIHC